MQILIFGHAVNLWLWTSSQVLRPLGMTRMTALVASQVRAVAALDKQIFASLGPLQSISFVRVSAAGIDTFHLVFKNGASDMNIALGYGKARDLQWHP